MIPAGRHDWMNVGRAHSETDAQRAALLAAVDRMTWRPFAGSTFSGMGGLAMVDTIRELRIPRVNLAAESPALAPFGFFGLHAHYRNGEAWIFAVHEGSSVVPVLAIFADRDWSLVPKDHPAYSGGTPAARLELERIGGAS